MNHPQAYMFRSIISLLVLVPNLVAQDSESETAVLRATISKVVDTQTLESKERLAWKAEKASMEKLLILHQKELTLLNEELANSGTSAPAYAETIQNLEQEISELKTARTKALASLNKNLPQLKNLLKKLPKPLQHEIQEILAALETQPTPNPRDTLQTTIAALDKIYDFNRKITTKEEFSAGKSVKILYLGLGQAFYLGSNTLAGTGHPTSEGWTWIPTPKNRPEIEKAFAIYEEKQPPALLDLPLTLREQ